MATFPAAVRELLDGPNPAVIVTADQAGTPQASVTWIGRDGDEVAFFSDRTSLKVKNLAVRPDVVVIVVDPIREFEAGARCYVHITGTAHITDAGATELADALAAVYMGLEAFPHPGDYVKVTVHPRRVSGIGPEVGGENDGWGP